MVALLLNESRRPFTMAALRPHRLLRPHEVDLAMRDSQRRAADVNPKLVAKAGRSVAELFSNWENAWKASFAQWARTELRLLVGQRSDVDLYTGAERIYQDWFVFAPNDCLLAWLSPVGGDDDPDSRSVDKLSAIAPDLSAELAEPKRYFVGMDAPSSVKRRWLLPPYLDMPGSGAHFETAVKHFCGGTSISVEPVLDRLGCEKVRCYMITSGGDFVLYKESVRNAELYVVNIAKLHEVITLADPVKEIDAYVARAIDQVVSQRG